MKLQFEATPDGNTLYSIDGTIRAIVRVPDGASDDYGYLTMKKAILDAYHGDPADLTFWYDGQEQYLAPDAAAPCAVQLDIEEDKLMTLRDYYTAHDGESPDCCIPYANKERTHYMVVYDGGDQVTIETPDISIMVVSGSVEYDETMERFAREVNPDYDLYSGWSDVHIAAEAMEKIGCASCPLRDQCEMLGEELEE